MVILKIKWKTLILCLAIPLAVGGVSAFLTQNSMALFASLNKPALSPPGWLFPIVWTILYVLMGIASYLVFQTEKEKASAFYAYGIQLAFLFFWPVLFFQLEMYLFAFFWLVVLWLCILLTTLLFYQISRPAGILMLPYLLWVTFAGYLNLSIALLN